MPCSLGAQGAHDQFCVQNADKEEETPNELETTTLHTADNKEVHVQLELHFRLGIPTRILQTRVDVLKGTGMGESDLAPAVHVLCDAIEQLHIPLLISSKLSLSFACKSIIDINIIFL